MDGPSVGRIRFANKEKCHDRNVDAPLAAGPVCRMTLASGITLASEHPEAGQPAPAGGHEQHMRMPQAPDDMPGMGMEHVPGTEGMGGHDMSPVDVSGAPAAEPDARGGQLSSRRCRTASRSSS